VDAVRVTHAAELAEIVAKSGTATGPLLVDVPITGHPSAITSSSAGAA
jgi:benzoylformate decarboxylase